jgi:hypothetical protein
MVFFAGVSYPYIGMKQNQIQIYCEITLCFLKKVNVYNFCKYSS